MPVDGRTGRNDAVIIVRVTLRFHQSLASTGRATHKIGIARSLAIERLCERLANDGHFMDAEVGIVHDGLPVQPPVRVERKAPASALVTGIGCARGVTLSHWSTQAPCTSAGKSTPAVSAKSSVPICRGQADENLDPIAGWRVCDRGGDA